MLQNDGFSRWLGIELMEVYPGKAKIKMRVRGDMLNGFNICHGGIPFSLADSAMAFASNSEGKISVSVENSISYIEKLFEGDELIAEAEELSSNKKISVYNVTIVKDNVLLAAHFKGIVYKTGKEPLNE